MRKVKAGGFTLIELMITVAIVGILAAIAYPSYTSHIQKGARRAAQAQMLDIANRQQQYLLANRGYATKAQLADTGYGPPDGSQLTGMAGTSPSVPAPCHLSPSPLHRSRAARRRAMARSPLPARG